MGKVSWTKPNDFTHCIACQKAETCPLRMKRPTAGCVNGKKIEIKVG